MKKPFNILVAIDSFKGSISSLEAGESTRKAILSVMPDAHIEVLPLADGGEGTMEALVESCAGKYVEITATGPLGQPRLARYGLLPDGTAVIEAADIAGLPLVSPEQRNPMNTTTFGLGEMILHAVSNGVRRFLIGLGGSATNDGGLGMLHALGVRFVRNDGSLVGIFGRDLREVCSVDPSNLDPRLKQCEFLIACDVDNPLCGFNGASFVFGPQKGATTEIAEVMDAYLKNYSVLVNNALNLDCTNIPGAGAAGGLGFAFLSFLPSRLESGSALVADVLRFEDRLNGKDILITGEGKLDYQTSMGKGPFGIASLAKKYGVLTIAVAGGVYQPSGCKNVFDACFSIQQYPLSLSDALVKETAISNLQDEIRQIFQLILAVTQHETLSAERQHHVQADR